MIGMKRTIAFLLAGMVVLLTAACGISDLPDKTTAEVSANDSANDSDSLPSDPAEESSDESSVSSEDSGDTGSEPPDIPVRNDAFHDAESTQAFVEGMGIGWNLGNTLDPVDCTWVEDELEYETAWDNPRTTRQLITYIKEQGFDTIRIPVTWANHVGEEPAYTVSEAWMQRVQEIVDWCIDEDLYVILNMQHDDGWLTAASTDYERVLAKYTAIWMQIAERFKGYSEKLIFESVNEIGFDDLDLKKGCDLLNRINAAFTDLIRSTGGNNAKRYLLLAGYLAEIESSIRGGIALPEDDRTILSLHYYLPPTFAIADATSTWGFRRTWGTEGDFQYLAEQFERIKSRFVDCGTPVIIGEFGAIHTDKDPEDVVLYTASVMEYALRSRMCPIWWDNGSEIDRTGLSYQMPGMQEAIAAAKEKGLAARSQTE